MEILFASQNKNKIKEIASLIPEGFSVTGLDEFIFQDELPETGNLLEENALQKARFVYEITGKPCFADDTGLEIEALDGRPGVYSARYAGDQKNANDNMKKILLEMQDFANRNARFRTVIAFVKGEEEFLFEGIVEGKILKEKRGENGFGYDPIFIPDGYSKSFAEMDLNEKNLISHRARALKKLMDFFNSNKDKFAF